MMKKLSIYVLLLCLLAISFASVSYANNEESSAKEKATSSDGKFEYCILEDGSAEITKYLGQNQVVTIPVYIGDYSVSSIGCGAFQGKNEIETITIPKGVSRIGMFAFSSCNGLKNVTIPESVVYIGSFAFSGCGVSSLTIPDNVVYIGEDAFAWCENLTDLTISGETILIRGGAFIGTPWFDAKCEENDFVIVNGNLLRYCGSECNVRIPDSVTAICEGAFSCDPFSDNSNLESIIIPEGVTYIGESAFEFCANLRSITIPDSVTYIGRHAFCGCESLKSIVIPEGVTSIGWETFALCYNLENITIPESVSYIGYSAFAQCDNLKEIDIPGNLVSVGLYGLSFDGNDSLSNVIINSIHSSCRLGSWNFRSSKAVNLKIPIGGVENVDGFDNLSSLTLLPDGSSSIPAGAFSDCDNLVEVNIPEGVVSFGKGAFEGSPWLSALREKNDFVIVNNVLVEYCGHESNVVIPDGVIAISGSAFSECEHLEKVSIPESVISFDEGVFEGTLWLEAMREQTDYVIVNDVLLDYCGDNSVATIPDGVTAIAPGAFSGNKSLTRVRIPDSVTVIGARAFLDCENLKEITIPSNVAAIGDQAFCNCISLTEVIVPDCVTEIGSGAFQGCSKLTNAVLSESIKEIKSETFSGCTSMKNVNIPEKVTSIEWKAFEGCNSIDTVLIPHNVFFIGEEAFINCSNLRELTIPEGVTAIAGGAFVGCESLRSLRIPTSVMFLGQNSRISDCESTLVYVVHGSYAEYFVDIAFAGPTIIVVE